MIKHPHERCQAITKTEFRHQQPWRKCCENRAAHVVSGVRLCGTHFNAAAERDIEIYTSFLKLEDGEFPEGMFK